MKVLIKDQNGNLIKESVVNSMNHYDMLINSLKANIYHVQFIEDGHVSHKTIHVKSKSKVLA